MFRYLLALAIMWCVFTSTIFAQHAVLRGSLHNANTGAPVEFAHVFTADSSVLVTTNTKGEFSFTKLKVAEYKLMIQYIGYQTLHFTMQLNAGENTIRLQATPSHEELAPVVVTGTGTRYKIDDSPVLTQIISGRNIEDISGRNVEEIISNLSSSFDYSSSSMGTYLKMNGLGKDYVLILVNGKRLTGGVGGITDLSRIHAEDIQQIEIVKGAASTLYGSDAIAGVINIVTKKTKNSFELTNSSRWSINNTWKQLNTFSFQHGKLNSKSSFSWKQNDGWQIHTMRFNSKWKQNHELPYLVPTYDMPANKKQAYTLRQELHYAWSSKLQLNASGSWYEKRLFFPFKGRMHNYYYNNLRASVGAEYKLSETDIIQCSLDYGNYKYYTEYPYKFNERYLTPDGEIKATFYPGDKFKNSEQVNITFQTKAIIQLNKKNKCSAGIEILTDELEAKYRLTAEKVNAISSALFVQDEHQFTKNMHLVTGARLIYHNNFGWVATPKVSAMYKLRPFTFRASYAKGFKSPTLKELHYYYESQRMGMYRLYLGNENLRPQQSNYYSLSTQYKKKSFNASLNLYWNQIYDMIDYQILPTEWDHARRGIEETKKRYNIHQARTRGFDLSFGMRPIRKLQVRLGYSFVEAKNLTDQIRLNGVSEHSATARVFWAHSWAQHAIKLNLSGTFKSDRFYLEEDLTRSYAEAYQLWKLTSTYTIKKLYGCKISMVLGVDNIFDYVDYRPYGSHYSTLNPGRSLFAGLNIHFAKGKKRK